MAAVELHNVSKSFGATPVLKEISLAVAEGELLFLLGPSGCGKTTLLRLLAGFSSPDSGTISMFGQDLSSVPPEKRDIAMVFQNYALWPHMTVAQNVAFGLEMRKVPRTEIETRVAETLTLARIAELAQRFPQELSGGQQQRVALARALAIRPRLILFDEPLSNLDTKLRLEMRQEIRALHAKLGVTMIYVTHDQGEALALGSRIAVMHAGRIAQIASPLEILSAPADNFVSEFMGHTSLFQGQVTKNGIEVSSGTIPISQAEFEKPGGRVSIAIRPEGVIVLKA